MLRFPTFKTVHPVVKGAIACVVVAILATALRPSRVEARTNGGGEKTGGAPIDLLTPLALQWKYTSTYFGYNPSSPAIAEDSIYFASGNRIYALDANSGGLK